MRWMSKRSAAHAIYLIIITAYMSAPIESLFADTRYVSDRLVISVRAGQNNESKVLGYIQSDTLVNILKDEGKYLKIKTDDGLEGWVNARYITSKQPNALIIKSLHNKMDRLQKTVETCENKALNSESSSSSKLNYEQNIDELEAIIKTHQQMVLNNERELVRLKKENLNLKSKMSQLKDPNKRPVTLKRIHWFLAGAGVLLFGFILGRLARKEKRTGIYR